VNEQFRVGDVSVKYNGQKVSGAFLMGATAQIQEVSNLAMLAGRMWTDGEGRPARAHLRSRPRYCEILFATRTLSAKT